MEMKLNSGKWASCLLLAAALLCSLFLYARLGIYNLDADLSSEMVLAQTLNEEHALISRNWFYSTELRVVSPVPIYQLGLMLFSSWHQARLFSVAVLMVLCVSAFLYAAKKAGVGEEAVYCAACIVLPLSWSSMFLFAWGGFYTVYFILGCVIFAQVLSLDGKNRKVHGLLVCILSFWAGLAGVRMLMILGVPLLLCFFLLWLSAAGGQSAHSELRSEKRWLAGAAASFCFMAAGYVVNIRVLSGLFNFRQYDRILTESFSLSELLKRFDALLVYFGYRDGLVLTTVGGAVSYLLIFIVPLLFVSAAVLLRKKELTAREKTIPLFGLCAVVFVVILDCMAQGYVAAPTSVGYYIMGLFFVLLCPFMFISRLDHLPKWVRHAGMCLLVVFFLTDSLCYVRTEAKGSEGARAKAARWLVENGYTVGYSSFWNGNILTELSDGKLEMITYERWKGREPQEWLQKRSHLTEVPQGPVFVYTDEEELGLDPAPCAQEEKLVYAENGVRIYRYEDAGEVLRLQREQIQDGSM